MAKNFKNLVAKMSPAAQTRVRARVQEILADMPLQALRQARQMSQETLAQTLGIAQPQVSKIENRTDVYVSTLRRYIEAMGGSLEIVATFPEGSVRVDLFEDIARSRLPTSTTTDFKIFASAADFTWAKMTADATVIERWPNSLQHRSPLVVKVEDVPSRRDAPTCEPDLAAA
jgi:transcriptional regulator with XRE-family HTH domain